MITNHLSPGNQLLWEKKRGCVTKPIAVSQTLPHSVEVRRLVNAAMQEEKETTQPPFWGRWPAGRNSTVFVRCSANPWNQFFARWALTGQSWTSAKPTHPGLTCQSSKTCSRGQSSCFQQMNGYIVPGILGWVEDKTIPKYLFKAAKIEGVSNIWALFALLLHSLATKTKTVPAPEILQE